MLELTCILKKADPTCVQDLPCVSLTADKRAVVRQRVELSDGQEAGIFLPPGTVLTPGTILGDDEGTPCALVQAAAEPVTEASTEDPLLLAKACYFLGNRHAPLQIAPTFVRFAPDHILSELCRRLGLIVTDKEAVFVPEGGAYAHHHHHEHSHEHEHAHPHPHSHEHEHHHDHAHAIPQAEH